MRSRLVAGFEKGNYVRMAFTGKSVAVTVDIKRHEYVQPFRLNQRRKGGVFALLWIEGGQESEEGDAKEKEMHLLATDLSLRYRTNE